jgi:arginine exporter protein ArgO
MPFDLRLPIAFMFGIFGLILVAVGIFGGPDLSQKSLGIDMNLWWGLVLLAFSALMFGSWKWQNRKK